MMTNRAPVYESTDITAGTKHQFLPDVQASAKTVHAYARIFGDRFRFVILTLCLFCLGAIFSNMTTINFTLICMEPKLNRPNGTALLLSNMTAVEGQFIPETPQTIVYEHPTHFYTQTEKAAFQWTVSIASMLATLPFSWLCTKYGAHYTFFASGIASALSTGLIPLAADMGFMTLIFTRIFQGLAYAMDFAVIGVLCARWAPLTENAKFIAVMTCFASISTFLSNFFSGIICESSLGWPWVHYIHCIVSLVLFIAWVLLYTDDPSHNHFITSTELAIIHRGKTEAHKFHEAYVPYTEICKDKVVWAVWLNSFSDLFSSFFLYIYAPTYIRNVLNYSTKETGIYGALGALSHIPVKMICGYISDTYHCMAERYKMWIFNTVALLAPAAVYVYLCFGPDPFIVVLLFGGVHAALGFNCGGFYKCGALVSRQYAEFVVACTQFIKCAVFFVAPALVAIFVQDERNATEWHIIFYMITVSLIISNIIFCIYATDEARPFTHLTAANRQLRKTTNS